MSRAFSYSILFLAVAARAVVSPATLNSDISILIHNDLLGENVLSWVWNNMMLRINGIESSSPHAGSGVLLLDAMPLQEALNSCNSLGESLWTSNSGLESIQNGLDYLVLQNRYTGDQRYWIAPVHGTPSSVDVSGRMKKASANEPLPVLCTQTAPYSTPDEKNTNATWQVTIKSNQQFLTG